MNRKKEEPSTMAVADGSAGRNSLEVNISPQRKKSMTEEEKRKKRNERAKRWRLKHPEKVKAIRRRYVERHPERVKENEKRYRLKHAEKIREREREYRLKNKEKRCAQRKAFYLAHLEHELERGAKYREEHREELREKDRIRTQFRTPEQKAKKAERAKEKYHANVEVMREYERLRYRRDREKRKALSMKCYFRNHEENKARRRLRDRLTRTSDPRLAEALRLEALYV